MPSRSPRFWRFLWIPTTPTRTMPNSRSSIDQAHRHQQPIRWPSATARVSLGYGAIVNRSLQTNHFSLLRRRHSHIQWLLHRTYHNNYTRPSITLRPSLAHGFLSVSSFPLSSLPSPFALVYYSSSTVLTMATIQRNYDPMPRLGLDKGVYSVPDVFAFDIGATGRKHSSILGYLSSALSGLLPCACAFAPHAPSVQAACDYDVPALIPDPRLPLHYSPSPTPTSASSFPFSVPCV